MVKAPDRLETKWLFCGLAASLAVQRLAELHYSRRNEQRLLASGGNEWAPGQVRAMQVLHSLWFLSMLAEVFGLHRRFRPSLASSAAIAVAAGQALRYAAIVALGSRWTVRVITLPWAAPVSQGIYRFIRHPNYLGVTIEILAFPLLHNAFLTAIFFSLLNALVLHQRIRVEDIALGYRPPVSVD